MPGVERHWLSEAEGFILLNYDTGRILPAESKIKVTDPLVPVTDSLVIDYDSADESSICSTPLPLLEKLASVELDSGPKSIKSILKSNSTFKAETLKGVTINEPTSAPAKGNKNVSASKKNSATAGKLKNVKTKDGIPLSHTLRPLKPFPPCKHYGFNDHQSDDYVNYLTCEICDSYDHELKGHNRIISLRRGIKPRKL
ncbi:hypothetical protein Tco_0950241 [Tanacetum coccineum]